MKEPREAKDLGKAKASKVNISLLRPKSRMERLSISSKLLWILKVEWPERAMEALFLRRHLQCSIEVIKQWEERSGAKF